jgi:hypothetical protein
VHRRLAAALVLLLAAAVPRPAHADEPSVVLVRSEAPVLVALRPLLPARATASPFLAPIPEDVRLSRGAKTAIIVTAIVVGVLLIAVVVSRPALRAP